MKHTFCSSGAKDPEGREALQMDRYNWKNHYAVRLMELENAGEFSHYGIEVETGKGEVTSCTVFPGIQAVYNNFGDNLLFGWTVRV